MKMEDNQLDWSIGFLDNFQLKQAFEEIVRFKETGILENGLVRQVTTEYKNIHNITNSPMEDVIKAILFRMAKEYYEEKLR